MKSIFSIIEYLFLPQTHRAFFSGFFKGNICKYQNK